MKKTVFLFVLLLLTLASHAQDNQVLVTPQWLNDHLKDTKTVILQIGTLEYDYNKEHIPGAQFLWPEWLAPNSPKGAFNAPDPKKATELLRNYGVSNDSHIVLVFVRNQVSVTSRMFLTMENLGLRGRVHLLDGGLEAWKKAGYAVTQDVPVVKKGNVNLTPGNLLVDKDYVLKDLNSGAGVIVDARMQRFYDGEPTGNPRDGHITGAKNIPYTDMVDQSNLFKSQSDLQGYFTPVVPDKGKEVVTYCFIGQTASVVYVAGRILGYDMKLYDGSMEEWSRIDTLPMEVTKK
ncbi:MAG TPA: rhodanese-like domain-containing protein [Cyclobacteriaceae bacterium]|nr:rhodanese-like domain-containing protein [Cyclobacteriaceae bacterium]